MHDPSNGEVPLFSGKMIVKYINSLPSVQKTGKWIFHKDWEDDGECAYECDQCGRTYD